MYAHSWAEFDPADFRKWGKAVEVADYDVSDTCADVADLINKTKAAAKKAFENPNDPTQLEPTYFIWGDPMLVDTIINPPDTSYWSLWGAFELFQLSIKTVKLVMVEDSLSDGPKFETLIHDIAHLADSTATEADIAKLEACVHRRLDKERKRPPEGGGGGGGGGVIITITTAEGYCEYERRVYCDEDEEGNTQDPCYEEWVLIYCTDIAA